MKTKVNYLSAFVLLILSTYAGAEIYKHVDVNGKVTYSNKPMGGGAPLLLSASPKAYKATGLQISGLGDFKIGMSYDDFDNWVKENGYKINKISRSDERVSGFQIFDLEATENTLDSFYIPGILEEPNYTQGFKYLTVLNYRVDGLHIFKVVLLFKGNKLIAIKTDLANELIDALNIKYGSAKEKSSQKPISCIYKITGTRASQHTDVTIHYVWPSPEGVSAKGYKHIFYDDKCSIQSVDSLTIEKPGALNSYTQLNNKARNATKDLKEEERRNERSKSLDKL